MKKNIIGFTLLTFLVSNNFAFSQKVKMQDIQENYTQVTILDKGTKRIILIPKDENQTNKMTAYSAKQLESKEGIMVSFKNTSQLSISEFETKYGLKFKKKLIIGYYIFKNISENSDTQIIANIIKNETNVKTVKPNWKLKNQPR